MKQFDPEEIKRIIADKYNWGPWVDWTNFHFKELCIAIETVTGDRLSVETLKRIFGKRRVNSENYLPQAFSQMVLLKFVESFENQGKEAEAKKLQKQKNQNFLLKNIGWISLVTVILISIIIFIAISDKPAYYYFKCANPRETYPFTASFRYDISEIDDSVFTDFGNNDETYLPPDKTMVNYFYTNSGIYLVKFYTRSHKLDSLKTIAWSRDWQGGYFPNSKPELFQPFYNQTFYRQSNYFYASPDGLKNEGVDLSLKFWTTYKYFSPFLKSLDNLILETRVLNNASTGSQSCYDAEISMVGDSGSIDFKFTQPKCSRWASLKVAEKTLDGKFSDLSAFSVDMTDWLQIRMTTANGSIMIYLDEKLIFTEKYSQRLGNLLGVSYQFFGAGKIDYLELKDSAGVAFYRNEFNTAFATAK